MENVWMPDIVLIGPGGAKALLELGCLKRLFEEKINIQPIDIQPIDIQSTDIEQKEPIPFLNNVKTWVGISAGAAICLLYVIGNSIDEIIDICMEINLLEDIIAIKLDEARQKLGLIKNKSIEDKLKQSIQSKLGFIPTLKQLYSLTGLNLSIVTYNLDKMRPEFLNKESDPDLSCIEAAMMSMAIPILIQPRKYKGCIYVDGALGAPYPVSEFDVENKKILGIYISSEEDLFCSDKKPISFLYRLIHSSMKVLRDNEIKYASKNVKHIPLKTTVRDTTGISLNAEARQDMIDQGYECANSFLKFNSNPEKYDLFLYEDEEIPFSKE